MIGKEENTQTHTLISLHPLPLTPPREGRYPGPWGRFRPRIRERGGPGRRAWVSQPQPGGRWCGGPSPAIPSPPPRLLRPILLRVPGSRGSGSSRRRSGRAAFVSGQPGGGPSAGVSDRWPGGGARQGAGPGRGHSLRGMRASPVVRSSGCARPARWCRGAVGAEGPPPRGRREGRWGARRRRRGRGGGAEPPRSGTLCAFAGRRSLAPADVRLGCESCRPCFSGQRPHGDAGGRGQAVMKQRERTGPASPAPAPSPSPSPSPSPPSPSLTCAHPGFPHLLPGVKTTLSDYFLFTGNTLKKHRSSSNQRSEGLAVICPGPVN